MPWLITFEVEGKGNFPGDMLRYDSCYPVGPRDVEAVFLQEGPGRSLSWEGSWKSSPPRKIRLSIMSITRNSKPTRERWRSLEWPVVSEEKHHL